MTLGAERAPLAVAALAALSVGCACWTNCVVVERRYEPAHDVRRSEDVCIVRSEDGWCVLTVPNEWTERVPDRWLVTWSGDPRLGVGPHSETVAKQEYDALEAGDRRTHQHAGCSTSGG